jgi:hypothetical protein
VWRIYEGLTEEAEDAARHFRKGPRRFRASETADCRRKLWYRLAGFVPLPKQPWLSLVADSMEHFGIELTGVTFNLDGTQDEDKYAVRTFSMGGVQFDMSCRPDGFVRMQELPTPSVLEIKSMTTFKHTKAEAAFKKGGNEGVIQHLQLEKPQYIWQGNSTAMIKDASYVYLVLVDRNLNRIGLGTVGFGKPGTWDPLAGERTGGALWEVEDSDRQDILYKLAEVTQALSDGVPPVPEYISSSAECRQCDFFVYCHGRKTGMTYPLKGVLSEQ